MIPIADLFEEVDSQNPYPNRHKPNWLTYSENGDPDIIDVAAIATGPANYDEAMNSHE